MQCPLKLVFLYCSCTYPHSLFWWRSVIISTSYIVVCLLLIHLLAFHLKWIIWLKRNKTHLHSFTCRDLQDHKPYFLWAAARLRSGEFWNMHFMKSVWKLWNPRISWVFIYWMWQNTQNAKAISNPPFLRNLGILTCKGI